MGCVDTQEARALARRAAAEAERKPAAEEKRRLRPATDMRPHRLREAATVLAETASVAAAMTAVSETALTMGLTGSEKHRGLENT